MSPRVFWLSVVVILSNVAGNLFLSLGVKHLGANPLALGFLALGVGLLILWTLSRMALLSWADLSYVLPVTSLGYVLSAVIGHYILSEHISWQRWSGTLLIMGGIALVGATKPKTTSVEEPR